MDAQVLVTLIAIFGVSYYFEKKLEKLTEKIDQLYEWNGGDNRQEMDFNREMDKGLEEIRKSKQIIK